MKQIVLSVPDNKFNFFMELVQNFKFVKIEKTIENSNEFEVPEWHKEIIRERIKSSKPEDMLSWEDVEKKLDAKYK